MSRIFVFVKPLTYDKPLRGSCAAWVICLDSRGGMHSSATDGDALSYDTFEFPAEPTEEWGASVTFAREPSSGESTLTFAPLLLPGVGTNTPCPVR